MIETRFDPRSEARFGRRENVSFSDVADGLWHKGSLVLLRRNIALISTCVLAALAAAVIYLLLAQPMFTAQAQLLIDPRVPQFLREGAGESSFGLDSSQLESHVVVLQSRAIASSVIKKLGLLEDPEFQKQTTLSRMPIVNRLFTSRDAGEENGLLLGLERFQERLRVRRIGISYAIEVAFSSESPEKAAKIANATTEAYLQSLIDFRSEAARIASDWLEERLARLRVQMNDANLRAQQFRVTQDYRIVRRKGGPKADAEEPRDEAASPNSEQATLEELELTAETYRKVYQNFFSAFTDTVQRESYPVSNARIISRADVPNRKSQPKTLLTLALGAMFGAFIGVSAALARQGLHQAGATSNVTGRKPNGDPGVPGDRTERPHRATS
jgi:uncharacterized protein involved in exopolysaccharide biosynthesis